VSEKISDAASLEPCSDEYVERLARILGESSGAAKAVADRDKRRASGEAAGIFLDSRGLWVVGPAPRAINPPPAQ
jgi:hypothetical protein